MRKILAVLFFLPLTAVLFAQNAEYKSLLAKAKQYESQKRFAYALGTYYDALSADPEGTEALDSYDNLASQIRSGKPGFGDFDSFTMHDEWKKLLVDAEKYWTEFPPLKITAGSLEKYGSDFTARTADYRMKFDFGFSEKYKEIHQIILTGLKKSKGEEWKDFPDELENWPMNESIFRKSNTSVQEIYTKHKVALIDDGEKKFRSPYSSEYYIDLNPQVVTANFSVMDVIQLQGFIYGINSEINSKVNTTDLKFSVFDENGKEIFAGKRCLASEYYYYFDSVSDKITSIIDSGKYDVRLTGLFIQYGNLQHPLINPRVTGVPFQHEFRDSVIKMKQLNTWSNRRSMIKSLPEINVGVEKISGGAEKNGIAFARLLKNTVNDNNFMDSLIDYIVEYKCNRNTVANYIRNHFRNNNIDAVSSEINQAIDIMVQKEWIVLDENEKYFCMSERVRRIRDEADSRQAILEAKNAGDWLRLRSLFDDAVSKNYAVTLADFELDEKTLDENVFMSRVNLELVKGNYAGAKEILREAQEKNVEVNFTESQVDEAECRKSIEKSVAAKSWEYVHSLLEDAKQKNYAFTISDFGLTDEELDSRRKEPYIAKMKQGLRTENFESVEEAISDARKKNLDVTFASVGLSEYKFEELKADKAEREKHFAIAAFRKKITDAFLAKNFEDAKSQYDRAVERGFTKEELALDPKILKKLKIK